MIKGWIDQFKAKSFQRKGLAIIKSIPFETCISILQDYLEQGWELAPEYGGIQDCVDRKKCQIRKGTSALDFVLIEDQECSVQGLKRIIVGLSNHYKLSYQEHP